MQALSRSPDRVGLRRDRVTEDTAPEPARSGDKVRIKIGSHKGARGVIALVRGHRLRVRLTDGPTVGVEVRHITNFSAAARLAWRRMPKRAGRPPSPRHKTRVSLRIDSETWEQLGAFAATGRIRSREHLVNTLLASAARRLTGSRPGGKSGTSLTVQSLAHDRPEES